LKQIYFDLSSFNPFVGGKTWIHYNMQASTGHPSSLLYDIDSMKIQGSVEGAWPESFYEGKQRTLCVLREFSDTKTLLDRARSFLEGLGLPFGGGKQDRVYFYVLGPGQAPIHLGMAHERKGAGNNGQPAPDGRFYRVQTTCDEHLIVDLDSLSFERIQPAKDWQGGWWSRSEILYMNLRGDLEIYDANRKRYETVMAFPDIEKFISENGLRLGFGGQYALLPAWGQEEDQFYLASNQYLQKPDWLVKLDKEERRLVLVSRSFPFARLGRFNYEGTHYVFSGETETDDSSAVYLFDLGASQFTTLVQGTKSARYYSLPDFYQNEIIYKQDDTLWASNFDGTTKRVLFDASSEDVKAEQKPSME